MKKLLLLFGLILLVYSPAVICKKHDQQAIIDKTVKKLKIIDTKVETITEKYDNLKVGNISGECIYYNDNKKPIRLLFIIPNAIPEIQIYNYDNGKLFFVMITDENSENYTQVFIEKGKVKLIIDNNETLPQSDKRYKEYNSQLIKISKALYKKAVDSEKPKSKAASKLDEYQRVTDLFCSLMQRQNQGENVYMELNDATQNFAYLNQELSGMIEDGELSKKQYNRFIKITEKYERCMY